MSLKFALFALFVSTVFARSTSFTNENSIDDSETPRASSDSYSYLNDFRYMYKVYQECATQDVTSCLKLKLLAALDRAARSYNLNVLDGVSFVKDPEAVAAEEPVKSEAEIEANLPRALGEKDQALTGMILNKVGSFLETHTLQIKLPSSADLARSFSNSQEEEGRGKKGGGKKGGGGMLLLPLILGGTMVPLALGALALLAGKALIISKLALVLAGIIGLKKLLAGNSGHHETPHVEVVSGHHGSGWGRSYDKEEAARLAYQAYQPKKEE
ncbi:uncharacterized protein LOC126742069 [Anthonomus grandis grandis]|uniref:uncharacterized protein LOC126742069 n=1 Tax=Anthonomus grandis grandis TaxID=2921223 RepID=UPI002166B683|nr:uncharacterized protein LOC126742069 [Anthonomus grandis grandis]